MSCSSTAESRGIRSAEHSSKIWPFNHYKNKHRASSSRKKFLAASIRKHAVTERRSMADCARFGLASAGFDLPAGRFPPAENVTFTRPYAQLVGIDFSKDGLRFASHAQREADVLLDLPTELV